MQRVRTDLHALAINVMLVGAASHALTVSRVIPPLIWSAKLDALVVQGLITGLVSMLILLAGHMVFRKRGVVARWAYAGLGALGFVVAMGLRIAPRFGEIAERGEITLYLALALVSGAIFGFLYAWRAGQDIAGDDPALLASTLEVGDKDAALVDTGQAEYFDGPVRVRTSVPVMFISALMAASLYGVIRMAMIASGAAFGGAEDGVAEWLRRGGNGALQGAVEGMAMIILGVVPVTVLILASHFVARGMNRSSPLAYGLIGLISPLVIGVMALNVFLLMGIMLALPTALGMVVYRSMAGLEPKPVREDIMVADRRGLVGAEHPRRRFGRVIKA